VKRGLPLHGRCGACELAAPSPSERPRGACVKIHERAHERRLFESKEVCVHSNFLSVKISTPSLSLRLVSVRLEQKNSGKAKKSPSETYICSSPDDFFSLPIELPTLTTSTFIDGNQVCASQMTAAGSKYVTLRTVAWHKGNSFAYIHGVRWRPFDAESTREGSKMRPQR